MTREDYNEQNAPDPGATRDTQWRGIEHLLKDADHAPLPTVAQREETRAWLRAELNAAHDFEDGREVRPATEGARGEFRPWLHQMLAGGGWGAQALRLAAVAGIAFTVGSHVMKPTSQATPTVVDRTVAHVPQPSPSAGGGFGGGIPSEPTFRQVNFDTSLLGSDSLSRSAVDDDGHLMASGVRGRESSPATAWFVSSHSGPAAMGSDMSAGEQTVELLQQLRLRSLVESDPESQETLRKLEDVVSKLLTTEQALPNPKAGTLGTLNRADDLLASGEAKAAGAAYEQVINDDPGSFLAFVAQFQVARMNFEDQHDYAGALASYRALIENYPPHYLTEAQRTHVLERVDLLSRNYQDNWEAVRLWQQAQAAQGADRVAALRDVVARQPESPLAADAAVALAAILVQGRAHGEALDAEALASLLQTALSRAGSSPHAAGLRFALAETLLVGLLEPSRAEAEYRALLTQPGADPYVPRANARLAQIARHEQNTGVTRPPAKQP